MRFINDLVLGCDAIDQVFSRMLDELDQNPEYIGLKINFAQTVNNEPR